MKIDNDLKRLIKKEVEQVQKEREEREFDIGKARLEAYEEGYMDALTDFENKIDAELTKACWYSKGKFTGLVKRFKEEFKERVKAE